MKRHNKAMKSLAAAKEKWQEAEQERLDKIREIRMELSKANADINETNKALNSYKRAKQNLQITYQSVLFTRRPEDSHLYKFYKPPREMKRYMYLYMLFLVMEAAGGLILSRYI